MAMNVGGSGDEDAPMMDINTTPLIDVMLVLIIMLIITIPMQTHAVKLDMPRDSKATTDVKPEVIDLEIDFDGTVFWNSSPVPTTSELNDRFTYVASLDPQPEIHLRPNRMVKYDYVAKVLASAQRLGVKRMGFVGNEQYME